MRASVPVDKRHKCQRIMVSIALVHHKNSRKGNVRHEELYLFSYNKFSESEKGSSDIAERGMGRY